MERMSLVEKEVNDWFDGFNAVEENVIKEFDAAYTGDFLGLGKDKFINSITNESEKDFVEICLKTFFISEVQPIAEISARALENLYSPRQCPLAAYYDFAYDTHLFIDAKADKDTYGFGIELRPIRLSFEELLKDLSIGLTCFVKEVEKVISQDDFYKGFKIAESDMPELEEHLLNVKLFIKLLPVYLRIYEEN